MPFRALVDGEIVTPTQVDDQQAAECPECHGVLYPREGEQRARHFFHAGDDSCSTAGGGESETHARCTALAVAALDEQFPEAASTKAEVPIDVSGTATIPDMRRADALVEFETKNPYFGNGLIIEVQHKHHSKDIEGTTHDYLSAGYSVAWLTPEDFEPEHLEYAVVNEIFKSESGDGYSIRDNDPLEFEAGVKKPLNWEKRKRECFAVNEYGSHTWRRIPSYAHPNGYEYEFCSWCESRRLYDEEQGRFVYDYQGVLAPDVPGHLLRDAVIVHPEVAEDFDQWLADELHGGPAAFEKALVGGDYVAPCRGPLGIHEWDRTEVIEQRYDGEIGVALWECRHCPVHLLTNFTGLGETESYILFGSAPDHDWGLSKLNGNPRSCLHPSHHEDADWDYCPSCFQNRP